MANSPKTLNYQQINLSAPNPFTFRPIHTDFKTNDLLLTDANMRIAARVAVEDVGLMESSNYVSNMHINPGWKWK
jgi:hypothetical protein